MEEGQNGREATQRITTQRPGAAVIALVIHDSSRRRPDRMVQRSGSSGLRTPDGGGQGGHRDGGGHATYSGHARMRITKAHRKLGVEPPVTLPRIRRAFLRLWYEKPPEITTKNHQIGLLNAYNVLKAVVQGQVLPRAISLHSRPRRIAPVSETRGPSNSLILHGAIGAAWWAA